MRLEISLLRPNDNDTKENNDASNTVVQSPSSQHNNQLLTQQLPISCIGWNHTGPTSTASGSSASGEIYACCDNKKVYKWGSESAERRAGGGYGVVNSSTNGAQPVGTVSRFTDCYPFIRNKFLFCPQDVTLYAKEIRMYKCF